MPAVLGAFHKTDIVEAAPVAAVKVKAWLVAPPVELKLAVLVTADIATEVANVPPDAENATVVEEST